jgi:hypothetical protein
MDLSELSTLAKALGKDEFARKFEHLFFLLDRPRDSAAPLQFRTEMADPKVRSPLVAGIIGVIKAAGSPYSDRISIGRARNCDVSLRDASISKLHAHIRKEEDGAWVLIDAGSHNGTLVRGEKVAPNQPTRLKSGDLLTFGSVTVRVVDATSLHRLLSAF